MGVTLQVILSIASLIAPQTKILGVSLSVIKSMLPQILAAYGTLKSVVDALVAKGDHPEVAAQKAVLMVSKKLLIVPGSPEEKIWMDRASGTPS